MKHLFYEDWTKKRIQKIINIFGNDWFKQKEILELGASHGDIGIELLKLGSKVHFVDVRQELLETITSTLSNYNFNATTSLINQNNDYSLNKRFDLVLNLGVLYHLENWKNDLRCALSHSNMMILESKVSPFEGSKDALIDIPDYDSSVFKFNYNYGSHDCKTPIFTQESIENELTNLGCKFIRFDNKELNSDGWINEDYLGSHVYDWTYDKNEKLEVNKNVFVHYRRMWLVLH